MTIVLVILLTLASVIILVGGFGMKVLYSRYQQALERKLQCPICGVTLLDNSDASRMVHVLCVMKSQEELEDSKKKAIEQKKAPVFDSNTEYKIVIVVEKSSVNNGTKPWRYDSETKQYLCYHWEAYKFSKSGFKVTIQEGWAPSRAEARSRAKAVVKLDKQSNEVIDA